MICQQCLDAGGTSQLFLAAIIKDSWQDEGTTTQYAPPVWVYTCRFGHLMYADKEVA